jgi:hypothetical protein
LIGTRIFFSQLCCAWLNFLSYSSITVGNKKLPRRWGSLGLVKWTGFGKLVDSQYPYLLKIKNMP